jgi:hypothetical protein
MALERESAKPLKVQATVSGFTAWVLREMMLRTLQSPADLGKAALDRWVAFDAEYLASLGITQARFLSEVVEGKVVQFSEEGKDR